MEGEMSKTGAPYSASDTNASQKRLCLDANIDRDRDWKRQMTDKVHATPPHMGMPRAGSRAAPGRASRWFAHHTWAQTLNPNHIYST
jgi:hypothetical protein